MIFFTLVCSPPPHVELQSLHSPHSLRVQSTPGTTNTHSLILQSRSSDNSPEQVPPPDAGVSIVLVRSCFPPPQVTLQSPHSSQSLNEQFTTGGITGHSSVLQTCVSVSYTHLTLPTTSRV